MGPAPTATSGGTTAAASGGGGGGGDVANPSPPPAERRRYGGGGGGGGDVANPTPPPAPSAGASVALAYAYAQLGKPYCYAGVGPDCFDCSGLTMMAWGQAGVAMPHGSTEQYNMFPHVALSDAQPGDLIVYDGHVGIYIGGGEMIHAPHTGTVVQISAIWPTPWGAARPG